MELKVQKRIAAQLLKCSPKKVWFDEESLSDIKEAITKADIKALISRGIIQQKPVQRHSRGRSRKNQKQKNKGRQRGHGSRKGKKTARLPKKEVWMNKVRIQRAFLKELRDKELISKKSYQDLYKKSKGGFFRSKRHIKIYLEEHHLTSKDKSKK